MRGLDVEDFAVKKKQKKLFSSPAEAVTWCRFALGHGGGSETVVQERPEQQTANWVVVFKTPLMTKIHFEFSPEFGWCFTGTYFFFFCVHAVAFDPCWVWRWESQDLDRTGCKMPRCQKPAATQKPRLCAAQAWQRRSYKAQLCQIRGRCQLARLEHWTVIPKKPAWIWSGNVAKSFAKQLVRLHR